MAGVTSQRPCTTRASSSTTQISEAVSSCHHSPHGLTYISDLPSGCQVMCPAMFSAKPISARCRKAIAICCSLVRSTPMGGTFDGAHTSQAASPRFICGHDRSSVDRISSRSWPLAILPPDDRGSSSWTSSRSGSSSLDTPCCKRCSTRAGRSSVDALFELDEHADPLAEERVGHCDGRRHRDRGMGRHGLLDLDRADVLAAAENEVRGPAGQREIAVGVKLADIAHPHPAVLREQLVVVGATQVSETECRAAARGLSASRLGDVVFPVEEPHLHLRHDPACRAKAAVQGVREGGRTQHPCLVGTVELQDRDAGQLLELSRLDVGERFAAGEHHPQTGQVVVARRRIGQDHRQLCTDAAQHCRLIARYGRAGGGGVEPLDPDRRGTEVNRRGVRGPDTEAERPWGSPGGTRRPVVRSPLATAFWWK